MPDLRSLSRIAMRGHPEFYMTVITLDPGYVIPDVIRDRDDDISNYAILVIAT